MTSTFSFEKNLESNFEISFSELWIPLKRFLAIKLCFRYWPLYKTETVFCGKNCWKYWAEMFHQSNKLVCERFVAKIAKWTNIPILKANPSNYLVVRICKNRLLSAAESNLLTGASVEWWNSPRTMQCPREKFAYAFSGVAYQCSVIASVAVCGLSVSPLSFREESWLTSDVQSRFL